MGLELLKDYSKRTLARQHGKVFMAESVKDLKEAHVDPRKPKSLLRLFWEVSNGKIDSLHADLYVHLPSVNITSYRDFSWLYLSDIPFPENESSHEEWFKGSLPVEREPRFPDRFVPIYEQGSKFNLGVLPSGIRQWTGDVLVNVHLDTDIREGRAYPRTEYNLTNIFSSTLEIPQDYKEKHPFWAAVVRGFSTYYPIWDLPLKMAQKRLGRQIEV